MGRWRAPEKPSSPYITPAGARALKAELKHLWSRERPAVVKALSEAAAEGDRSENAEYIYRKKQLGEIDRRVRYLSKRLDVIEIVDRLPSDTSRVRFGAVVTVEDEDSNSVEYRIVGADETDAPRAWISIDSPVARQLLGKSVGDEVTVTLPEGQKTLLLTDINYPPVDS